MNNEEFLDYWYEYSRFIPFPQTPGTTRRLGNFLLHSMVADQNHPGKYNFYYGYDGQDTDTIAAFKNAFNRKYHYTHGAIPNTINVDGKDLLHFRQVNFSRNQVPKYCYYMDFFYAIEYAFSNAEHFRRGERFKNKELIEFQKILKKEAKTYSTIRNKQYEEKFGKTLQEFLKEKEQEKEQQKSIIYSTLVGEAYSTLERLRDECNGIMKGLQDGRHGYTLDQYKAFKNEILGFNKYLGYKNEFIKTQIKQGSIRQQTLLMFLRDNSKKPDNKKKK